MKRTLIALVVVLVILPAVPIFAQDAALEAAVTPAATEAPAKKSIDPEHLKGVKGYGLGYFGGAPAAISFRKWFSDNTAWEVAIGAGRSTRDGDSSLWQSPLTPPTTDATTDWKGYQAAASLGFKRNFARPVSHLLVQFQSFLQYRYEAQTQDETIADYTQRHSRMIVREMSLFVGPGFEAFLPYWSNLSVEGSLGLDLSYRWVRNEWKEHSTSGDSTRDDTVRYLDFTTTGTGLSIVNGQVHFYF
jgi:hypothetical protein